MDVTLAERIERRNKQLRIVNILSFPDLSTTPINVSFMQRYGHEVERGLQVVDPKGNRFTLEYEWRNRYYAYIQDGLFWLRRFYRIEGEAWFCLNYTGGGCFTMEVYDEKGKEIRYRDFSIRVPDPAPMELLPEATMEQAESICDNFQSELKDTGCSSSVPRRA